MFVVLNGGQRVEKRPLPHLTNEAVPVAVAVALALAWHGTGDSGRHDSANRVSGTGHAGGGLGATGANRMANAVR